MGYVPAEKQEPRAIGFAGMKYDGTIILRVRAKGDERALQFCAPGDHNYAQVFAHLGGLQPGQTEPVSPWPIS